MLPPSNRDAGAKARAAAAAAVAAASVTPGQRDRAIQQAVLAAQNARDAAAAAAAAAPSVEKASPAEDEQDSEAVAATATGNGAPSTPGTYEPPEWSGIPDGAEFGLEVLKNGTLLEEKPLTGQAYFTFGRSPTADVLLEHPTASRLHAVLQFKDGTKEVFLYDCGSTHGTFLNKNRLKARVHAPMRVGDTVRFGQSSRMYVLTGPQELLPQEGLSKQQKKQLKLLEAAQRQKEADEAKARAQMEAALASGADGATWGMGPDIDDYEQAGPGQDVNWRAYVDKHGSNLTDRQTKLLDKIRKREYKIKNLEAECAKIAAKEKSEGGLTQGQASTLVRNERALDALREELEELEDQMTDCITDSIKSNQAAQGGKEAKKKRKRQPDSDDEYANRSDSDDEFYDRTVPGQAAAAAQGSKKQAGKGAKGTPVQQVESAESLYAKRSALIEEKDRLEAAIAAEQQLLQQQQQQQHKQQQPAATPQDDPDQQEEQAEPNAAPAAQQSEAVDSLDAFMEDVAENLEMDKLTSLKKELESIQQQLQRTERLIQIADPAGWYKPGSGSSAGNAAAAAAAKAVKEAATAALEADRQRRAAAVAAQRAGWAAANANEEVQPEVEDEGEDEQPATEQQAGDSSANEPQQQQQGSKSAGGGSGSSKPKLVVLKPKGILATAALRQTPAARAADGGNRSGSSTPTAAPAAAAAAAARTAGEGDRKAAAAAAAQQLMQEFAQPAAAAAAKRVVKGPSMPPPGYKAAAPAAAKPSQGGSNVSAAAAARVAASIAILTSHRAPLDAEGQPDDLAAVATADEAAGVDEQGGWLPPAEQTGDGKTSLNAKFGY